MTDYKEKLIEILKFFTNRLFLCGVAMVLVFAILLSSLFDRQIVQGSFNVPVRPTFMRTIPINAPRGQIFDIHGRPLAVNFPVNIVMLDPSTANEHSDLNAAFLFFIEIMRANGEEIDVVAEFFISEGTPRAFTAPSEAARMRWLRDIIGDEAHEGMGAQTAYEELMEHFDIPVNLDAETRHQLLVLRTALYLQRFNLSQIQLAIGIEEHTVAALEEHNYGLPGVYVAMDYLRYYPEGRYLTNIVGFINNISSSEFERYGHLGYNPTDLFGRSGVEAAFEHYLRGQRGEISIEVDNSFRRVNLLNERPPVPGDDIFLTVDAHLQRNIYYILENTLSQILINRLTAGSGHAVPFTREILASMVTSNNISVLQIMQADEELAASYQVRNFVLQNSDIDIQGPNFIRDTVAFLAASIDSGQLNVTHMLNVLYEQDIISISFEQAQAAQGASLTPALFLSGRIESREITPQLANVNPATGSVVVVDIHTGGVLAAVNYPTFDGNKLLGHQFDQQYFARINLDPTNPQLNRAFAESRAPGSTFKMITALAALSTGVITPDSTMVAHTIFRDAGFPYIRCWIHGRGSHGRINVSQAIAVSSNYFFNRVAFQMGNRHNGGTLEGISILNYYMHALGLGQQTGVEIQERAAYTQTGTPRMASPEYQTALGRGSWSDGYTAQVSIGQGLNDYTPASMAKFMATLANGGTRMQMHLRDRTVSADGQVSYFEPVVEYQLEIDPSHLDAIFDGMLSVTRGRGTGAGIFAGFPMEVGVKSGTAETGTAVSHSTYIGFAPFDNPQIAVYVIIPFGDTTFLRGSAGHVIRDVFAEYFGLNRTAENSNDINILLP